jgi:hypothetical protein
MYFVSCHKVVDQHRNMHFGRCQFYADGFQGSVLATALATDAV